MVLVRIITVGVCAVVVTAIGVMTIGLAETVRYGLIGLAAAVLLLGLLRISGRSSRSQGTPPGGGSAPASPSKPGAGSEGSSKE